MNMPETPLEKFLRETSAIADDMQRRIEPVMNIIKQHAFIQVSDELLMDEGIIPDTRPQATPPSRRTRFRWWRGEQRERLARWLFRRLAGYDVPDGE